VSFWGYKLGSGSEKGRRCRAGAVRSMSVELGRADGLSFPHASFFVLEHEGKDKLLTANEL
jgi:hypothetical protein